MIRLHDLTKRYGTTEALRGVTLEVREGELFAYLGPNGSGKTTTIKILTGLADATSGTASVGGHDVAREPLLAKRMIGLVSQVLNIDADLTVAENLDIHGRLFGMGSADRRRRTDELLEYVDLVDRRDSLVRALSGGLKRRLMIARAMMHEPRVLFLDEPSVGLDPAIRRRIWALVKKIQKSGATVFLTTHYIEEAEFLADRVAFLDEGRIVVTDTPRNLMDSLGQWAVDDLAAPDSAVPDGGDGIETRYFASREEAGEYIASARGSSSLRRVNLEDAFMRHTGRKVAGREQTHPKNHRSEPR